MIKNLIGIILFLSIATTAISETIAPSPAELKTAIKLAEQGDAEANFALGGVYYFGLGVQQDYAKAIEWYKKAAAQDHAGAQFALGGVYNFGLGVRQDYAKAIEWYEKAAAQDHADAQFFLGIMYDEGLGVRQNLATAKEWFGKACDNGNQNGCDSYRRINMNH